jgi:ABC-type amino acid transport substrate-binding protein
MYVKRAGLVWTLVLLITTCFILTYAAPGPGSDGSKGKNRNPTNDTTITSTTEPPTVLRTPPATSADEVGSSGKANEKKNKTATGSNNSSEDVHSEVEEDTTDTVKEEFLYFEITKCITEHNLTLDDIQYVLSQKDDENQFMFRLADKLGYMSDGKHDDPHILVIRSHREKLIEMLEKMAVTKKSKPPSQEEHNEESTVADKSPGSNEPGDINEIGYEISTAIGDLGPDAIYDILNRGSFSDALGYAVGIQLGYSPKDEHMKYLENANVEELKERLQQTLKSKIASQQPPNALFNSQHEPTLGEGQDQEVVPSGGVPSSVQEKTTDNEEFLFFQIRQRISEHNLTLDDIQYILSEKDDEDQFMYTLAFKLGYMRDGKHDDPHIPVIRSHREKLIEMLEKVAAAKVPKPPSQKQPNEDPTVADEPVDINEIGYEVSTAIDHLGPDAIYDVLNHHSLPDILGYAVGMQLGYSRKDEHMKYLENVDVKELKELLQRTLKSKLASQQPPNASSNSQHEQTLGEGQDQEVVPSGGVPSSVQEKTTDNEEFLFLLIEILEKIAATKVLKPPSQEQPNKEPTVTNEPVGINVIGYEVSTAIDDLGPDAIYDILNHHSLSDVLGYAVGMQLGYSHDDKHMKYLENADVEEL